MVEVRLDRSQRSRTRSRMRESNAGQRNGKSHVFGFSGFPQTCFLRFKRLLRRLYFWRPFASSFEGSPLHVYLLTSREFQFGNRRPAITSCPVVHLVAISICRGLRYRWLRLAKT
jgi:hypothetical protein